MTDYLTDHALVTLTGFEDKPRPAAFEEGVVATNAQLTEKLNAILLSLTPLTGNDPAETAFALLQRLRFANLSEGGAVEDIIDPEAGFIHFDTTQTPSILLWYDGQEWAPLPENETLINLILISLRNQVAAASSSSAIVTLRDGVAADRDTLQKLSAFIDTLAPRADPVFTGAPTATTPSGSDDSERIATTAFVQSKVNALLGGVLPTSLDTIREIVDYFGNNPNAEQTVFAAVDERAEKSANLSDLANKQTARTNLKIRKAFVLGDGTDADTIVAPDLYTCRDLVNSAIPAAGAHTTLEVIAGRFNRVTQIQSATFDDGAEQIAGEKFVRLTTDSTATPIVWSPWRRVDGVHAVRAFTSKAEAAADIAPREHSTVMTQAGAYRFTESDQSAGVASDPGQGLYIAPAADVTGASGAYVWHQLDKVRLSQFDGASQNERMQRMLTAAPENAIAIVDQSEFQNAGTLTRTGAIHLEWGDCDIAMNSDHAFDVFATGAEIRSLNADYVDGATEIIVPDFATLPKAGDVFRIITDAIDPIGRDFGNLPQQYRHTDDFHILSATSSGGETTLILRTPLQRNIAVSPVDSGDATDEPLVFPWTTALNARVIRRPQTRFSWEGGNAAFEEGHGAGAPDQWNVPFLRLRGLYQPRVSGLDIERGYGGGVDTVGTYSALIEDGTFANLENNPSGNQYGYAVADKGWQTEVRGMTFLNVRHGYTSSELAITTGETDWSRLLATGAVKGFNVHHCYGANCIDAPFDTHLGALDGSFHHNKAENCTGYGFGIRGENIEVTDNRSFNTEGLLIQTDYNSGQTNDDFWTAGKRATTAIIRDNVFRGGPRQLRLVAAIGILEGKNTFHATDNASAVEISGGQVIRRGEVTLENGGGEDYGGIIENTYDPAVDVLTEVNQGWHDETTLPLYLNGKATFAANNLMVLRGEGAFRFGSQVFVDDTAAHQRLHAGDPDPDIEMTADAEFVFLRAGLPSTYFTNLFDEDINFRTIDETAFQRVVTRDNEMRRVYGEDPGVTFTPDGTLQQNLYNFKGHSHRWVDEAGEAMSIEISGALTAADRAGSVLSLRLATSFAMKFELPPGLAVFTIRTDAKNTAPTSQLVVGLLTGRRHVIDGDVATLDAGQQADVFEGVVVREGNGRYFQYSGTGSKTDKASYLQVPSPSITEEIQSIEAIDLSVSTLGFSIESDAAASDSPWVLRHVELSATTASFGVPVT
ncbi:MAG: pyocin knob domain-containing protein [Pseudomonadota bacterium]